MWEQSLLYNVTMTITNQRKSFLMDQTAKNLPAVHKSLPWAEAKRLQDLCIIRESLFQLELEKKKKKGLLVSHNLQVHGLFRYRYGWIYVIKLYHQECVGIHFPILLSPALPSFSQVYPMWWQKPPPEATGSQFNREQINGKRLLLFL